MSTIGVQVGDRLRAIRRQKGLSLHEVEARSGQEFKASVLGAYERGERALSVSRLVRLAELYDVPPDQLLPRDAEVEIDLTEATAGSTRAFTIDLVRLHELHEPDAEALGRYASRVQVQRQDFNGRFLTIRRDDLRVLAAVLGQQPRRARGPARRARPARPRLRRVDTSSSSAGSSRPQRAVRSTRDLRHYARPRRDNAVADAAQGARSGQPSHGRVARPARRAAAPHRVRVPRRRFTSAATRSRSRATSADAEQGRAVCSRSSCCCSSRATPSIARASAAPSR